MRGEGLIREGLERGFKRAFTVVYLAFGPQSGSGFSGNLEILIFRDIGFASSKISNETLIFGDFDNMAAAGDRPVFFCSFTGCSFSQHRKMSQITRYKQRIQIIAKSYTG